MSINAIKDLVEHHGFNLSNQSMFTGQGVLVASKPKKTRGSITFDIICNVHSVDSSSLFFGDEIRSFGIRYQEHKPMFNTMEFIDTENRLNFKSDEYDFYLEKINIE